LSQTPTLLDQSQAPPLPTDWHQGEIWQQPKFYLQPKPPSLPELAEPVIQGSPTATNKRTVIVFICIACNKLCKNKSSLLRHQAEHCEREVEWLCSLCVPRKRFYRKDRLSQHHINCHGEACVAGCKQQQGGLCQRHLSLSMEESWPKKAWGCPCCIQCFDSLAAWNIHSASHPVQNDSVVGWSLSTMVQSLLLQPYLREAIAGLPWHICDLTKVKAEVCQALREMLERHKLPTAVHDHYNYRHLLPPEKLAHYAFRQLANEEVFPDDVSNVASGHGAGDAEPICHRRQGQMLTPVFDVSGPTKLGHWSSEDPPMYDKDAHQSVGTDHVHEPQDAQSLSNAGGALFQTGDIGATAEPAFSGYSLYPCNRVWQTGSDISSRDQASSRIPVSVPSNTLQEISYGEKAYHDPSMQKPLHNLVHLPSSANFATLSMKPLPPSPNLTDATRHSRSGDRHRRLHTRSPSRNRETRQDDCYGFEGSDQITTPAFPNTMTLEPSETPAAVDHNTASTRTEPEETEPTAPQSPRLSVSMLDIRSDDWLLWEPDKPHNL
jgi:hypothetical protein